MPCAQFYTFWREQHKLRQAAKAPATWRKRTWNQMKAQHKLLRVFYQKYELGEDPMALHTGAQKATVLYCLIMVKLAVSSLLSQASSANGLRRRSDTEEILFRVMVGGIAAFCSLYVPPRHRRSSCALGGPWGSLGVPGGLWGALRGPFGSPLLHLARTRAGQRRWRSTKCFGSSRG